VGDGSKSQVDPGHAGMVASWVPVVPSAGLLWCWFSVPGLLCSWESAAGLGVCVDL
jgi:hypothetical protein